MSKHAFIVACLICAFAVTAQATRQIRDIIIYQGEELRIDGAPFEAYCEKNRCPHFPEDSSANWRGYVATWEIESDTLYLIDISTSTGIRLDELFLGQEGKIRASWFTGKLRIRRGKLLLYDDSDGLGYGPVCEQEVILSVQDGRVIRTELIDNTVCFEEGPALKSCDTARECYKLGTALLDCNYDNRKEVFTKAVQMCPAYADAHVKLADAYKGLRDFEAAENHYTRAVALGLKSPVPFIALAELYLKTGRYGLAVTACKKGLEIDSANKMLRDALKSATERLQGGK
jgi:tetratricopeptide (TPR) repeat protein